MQASIAFSPIVYSTGSMKWQVFFACQGASQPTLIAMARCPAMNTPQPITPATRRLPMPSLIFLNSASSLITAAWGQG